MQNLADQPSKSFLQLLDEWSLDKGSINKRTITNPGYNKTRIVKGTTVIDILWYPINDMTHRNWYDVTINNMTNNGTFIGSIEELDRHIQTFKEILYLSEITTKSTSD